MKVLRRPNLAGEQSEISNLTLPLVLNGRSFGSLTLSRNTPWLSSEVDSTQVLIVKLSELIRQAQLNDVIQRDTFRDNFLVEINNLMTYSLGAGDALFMVVNILGKVLRASRCLFVCTDNKTDGWKCYEFWQQDKVKSCQECHWPTNDSSLIAQALRSSAPLKFYEGQENSYLTPAQAELQFSGTRSLLALPLLHEQSVYGCVIIQQCDYRRDWTRDEVDMVQLAADRVAQALANLPEEKRIHKPIMQLHQRLVAPTESTSTLAAASSMVQSLKGAFGQKSIPSAKDTLVELPAIDINSPLISLKSTIDNVKAITIPPESNEAFNLSSALAATKNSATANKLMQVRKKAGKKEEPAIPATAAGAPSIVPVKSKGKFKTTASNEAVAPVGADSVPPAIATTGSPAGAENARDGLVASLLTPTQASPPEAEQPWGNLDAIPTPSSGPAMSGLGASMIPKVKSQHAATDSPLRSSLYKDKPGTSAEEIVGADSVPPAIATTGSPAGVKDQAETPSAEPASTPGSPITLASLDAAIVGAPIQTDTQAQERVQRALSSREYSKQTSDYISAITNVDPRTLARIASWVEEIEKKDKYLTPHAITVAEYACAIAKILGLSPREIDDIRLASLLHDVGKLGTSGEILQKRDEDLDDTELLTMMRHPLDGAELLETIPDLAAFAPTILAHHEEFAGTGYPQGLKGEEIPLPARIIFLANSYHGLISDTHYGKGVSAQEAMQHLQEESGKQHDPALVEIFLTYLKDETKH